MDRKIVPAAALIAMTLLFNQRPGVVEYAAHAQSATAAPATLHPPRLAAPPEAAAAPTPDECAIGAHCDALVPLRDTGPWVASCAWFGTQTPSPRGEPVELESNVREKLGRYPRDWCLDGERNAARLQFLIVTLPDPTTTHLALYFDRSIDAVERAANLFELYLARYWLPWPVRGPDAAGGNTSEDLRVNEILSDFRSAQPGVLIFTGRAPHGREDLATFVFLVGESPTSGINKAQFENAAAYAHTLCREVGSKRCPNPPKQAVGPFFSGSVPSVIDLKSELDSHEEDIDFISGSMSSAKQAQILRDNGLKSFASTQPGDEYAEQLLLEFLQAQHLTHDLRNVAILQENETRYSASLQQALPLERGGGSKVRRFIFPRELTQLRNASASAPAMPTVIPGVSPPSAPGPTWSWSDTGKGEDRVPSFSGAQQPLSAEAILQSIAETIRQEHIQYVGIIATDVFDILYLSRFLKMSLPNTRLFVFDSDLLMVHSGAEGRELDGTLVVTTYPLIARSEQWPKDTERQKLDNRPSEEDFPSRVTQGLYKAVYQQMRQGGAQLPVAAPEPAIAANPGQVWITMVGRVGFWPVTLGQSSSLQSTPSVPSQKPPPRTYISRGSTFDPPDVATTLLEGTLLLWGILHLVGMWFGSRARHPWLEQFRIRPSQDKRRYAQHQIYYLMCATLALSVMLALTVIPVANLWLRGSIDFSHPILASIADVARAAVALALLVTAATIASRNHWRRLRPWIVWYLPWLISVFAVAGWIWVSARSDATGAFFSERAFYLGSGVSPLLPVEFLVLIYYAWSWTCIRKVRLSESKQIRVPELEELGVEAQGFSKCCIALVRATDRLVFHPKISRWMLISFFAAVAVLIRPWSALRSVEGVAYDAGFVFLFFYICLLIVLVWGRYMYIWSILSRILRSLERTPLRRAFSRLPESLYSWSPLWYEDAQRRAHTISSRSLECFQAIVHRHGYGSDAQERLNEMTEALGCAVSPDTNAGRRAGARATAKVNSRTAMSPEPCLRPAPGFPPADDRPRDGDTSARSDAQCKAAVRLQRILMDTAQQLLRRHLLAGWAKGGSDTLDEEERAQESARSEKLPPYKELQYLQEEFVALRYVGLIHYESAQLKNLVVLLVTSFVLALISVGSYPFLAGRLFVWTMAGVFVLFGAGIIVSFAQMSRDAILSRLSGTDAGKLDVSFYLRVLSFSALPLLALLASQFPAVGHALTSWLEPALTAMH